MRVSQALFIMPIWRTDSEDVDSQTPELTHGFQQDHGIPGESGNGLSQHDVYFVRLFDTM